MESVSLFTAGIAANFKRSTSQIADIPTPEQQRLPDPVDTVEISPAARKASEQADRSDPAKQQSDKDQTGKVAELSASEIQQLKQLQQRDQEVRAHENAHRAAAGGLVISGPSYSFQRGPDGKAYAVGGEVQISTGEGSTPEETISSARQAQKAALAPQQPSSQDRAVAARAGQRIQQAQIELAQLKASEAAASIAETDDTREQSADSNSSPVEAANANKLQSSREQQIQQGLDVVA